MDAETRQKLLELVYELLPAEEAAELRRKIALDAELARAYADAQETAHLLGEAAHAPVSKPQPFPRGRLEKERRTMNLPAENVASPGPVKTGVTPAKSLARTANWIVGLAAAVLVLGSVGGYFYHRGQLSTLATEHLRLIVTGPSALQAGSPAEFTVSTTAISGQALPARVEVTLLDAAGKRVKAYKETADEHGRLQVAIPADLPLASQAKLRVVAMYHESREEVETPLSVEPVRYVTHLSLDKPLYQPGESVYYRSLTLSRFGQTADRQTPIHFEITDPSGAVVPNSPLEGTTDRGVGNGAFTIPDELPGGQYTLIVRSPEQVFPEEKRTFFIRQYRLPRLKKELEFARDSYAPADGVVADFQAQRTEGGAAAGAKLHILASVDGQTVFEQNAQAGDAGSFQIEFKLPEKIERGDGQLAVIIDDGGSRETISKTIPINLGKVEVAFYPEGGDLVPGLENRVYFTARDPLGKPVHIRGKIVTAGDAKEPSLDVAELETTHEGMGVFSIIPRAGDIYIYRLKITSPAGVKSEPKLPEVAAERKAVLTTGPGVFAPGTPLEFNVRAAKPALPLVVAAYCRGVQVGEQPLVTKSSPTGANPVSIPLDGAVSGVVRLTVFDYSVNPPLPVAERLVYRRPAQKLNIRAAGHNERYSPGEKVNMSLVVTNEKNEPVPAVLGVAVVDGGLLSLADDHSPAMTTHLLLTSEIDKPEDLEKADFYLSDETKSGVPAAVALDLLLGTQGWRRFAEKSLHELKEKGQDDRRLDRLAMLGGVGGPPIMADNIKQIRENYEKSLAEYQADRTKTLNTLTTVSFFGGLGLVLMVAMLGLLRIVSGLHLWVSAIGAATCCLIVGAILMDPGRLTPGNDVAVAFLSYHAPVAAPEGAEARKSGDKPDKLLDVDAQWGIRLADRRDARDKNGRKDQFRDGWAKDRDNKPMPVLEKQKARAPGFLYLADDMEQREDAKRAPEPVLRTFVVRQYANQHVAGQPGVRSDFVETLYWNPLLIADADGKASVSFELSDAVTSFRLLADGHGAGRIGSGQTEIISRIPFNLEPKLPLEVTAGDRIDLPLAVVNDTKGELPIELQLDHGDLVKLDGQPQRKLELAAGQRGREYFLLDVTGEKGNCELTFRGTAGTLADAVKRPLRIVPPGFPKSASYSGQIDGSQEIVVSLPGQWVHGSLEVTLSAFPSTLANLQKGLEGILQEPNGCFEQASTSNYPNVMTMQYIEEDRQADTDVIRRAKELLKKGYGRLTGYECKQRGYEWFGGDPGHEALTAYGLMQFRDMRQVYDVDAEMVQRTAEWLMTRRDGKGGFQRNPRALDSFGQAPADVTDAYIVWALSESGQKGIEAEVAHVVQAAEKSDDPYVLALAAATAINADKKDDGRKLLDKLASTQADDGHLEGKQGSITRSGGQSLQVETTALAALAWLKTPDFTPQANKAIEWITKNRQGGGGFGSTQATILALKALVQHAKSNRRTLNAGKLLVQRDGQTIGQHTFSAGVRETIAIDGLEANLKAGDNKLAITLTGNNKMPYAMKVAYRTLKPDDSPECPVRLTTKLAKSEVQAGETVAMEAELTNATDQGQPMTVAIVGLPAGLEPRPDQLEELKKAGTIDFYETRAREVIFYWRSLAPKKQTALKLDLVAAVPGKYVGPASRTYLYYTAEHKQWCEPLAVEITREKP